MKYSKMIFMAISFVAVLGYASAMTEIEENIDTPVAQVAEEPAAPAEVAPVAEVPASEVMPVAEMPAVSAQIDEVAPAAPVEEAKPVDALESAPTAAESKSQDEADMEEFFKEFMIDENETQAK